MQRSLCCHEGLVQSAILHTNIFLIPRVSRVNREDVLTLLHETKPCMQPRTPYSA